MLSNSKSDHLSNLSYILNFEISTLGLWGLSFFYAFLYGLVIIAAVLFTPYLLFVLFKEKRHGWITFFILLVLLPLFLVLLFTDDSMYTGIAFNIVLAFFFLYCFLLKFSVKDWLHEREAKRQWELEKLMKSRADNSLNNN